MWKISFFFIVFLILMFACECDQKLLLITFYEILYLLRCSFLACNVARAWANESEEGVLDLTIWILLWNLGDRETDDILRWVLILPLHSSRTSFSDLTVFKAGMLLKKIKCLNICIFSLKQFSRVPIGRSCEGQSRSFAHYSVEAIYRGWGQFQNYSGNLWGLL